MRDTREVVEHLKWIDALPKNKGNTPEIIAYKATTMVKHILRYHCGVGVEWGSLEWEKGVESKV